MAVAAGVAAGVGDWLAPLHAAISASSASTRSASIRGITDVNRSVRTGALATMWGANRGAPPPANDFSVTAVVAL